MRKSSKTTVAADSLWYIVDDQTVVQSWFNSERERTEYVRYATTKRVAEHQLRTAEADFHRAYRSGEGPLVALVVLALLAILGIFAGALFLPTMLESQSSLPLVVLVGSGALLVMILAVFSVYGRSRLQRQRQFVAELGFDQRKGSTLKKRQVEELDAATTVTVQPAR